MRHAKWLAVLVFAGSVSGCCGPRWPTQDGIAPAKAYVRYVALAVKKGDDKCFEAAQGDDAAKRGCAEVYGVLKRELIKLEEEP
jgi:hypothetical protein